MPVETFANQPATTVTSGGTDAPSPGTQQTWTVASSSTFPAANSGASPPTQFHVADTATGKTSEIIAVTNVSGTTWTVTRGAESTTPVAHSAGLTVVQVVSAGAFGQMLQAANNLSDVGSASAARTNLGLSGAATASLPLSIGNGGTGQSAQQAALNALAGAVTSGQYLRGNGTNVVMAAIQAADVPALNQNTTGNAATATNLAGGATLPAYLAPKVVTLTQVAGSVAIDASLGNVFTLTLTASGWTIANPTNPADGQAIRIRLVQDSTGGRTVSWGTAYNWGSTSGLANSAPTLTATAAKRDYLPFEYDAGLSKWVFLSASFPQGY